VSDTAMRCALRDSVKDVLEKMFFVQTLGESHLDGPAFGDQITAQVIFAGQPPGALTMRVTSAAARQIAADFLGVDEQEVSDLRVAEVVCELANMICGSVLSRMESDSAFHLSTPQIVPSPESTATSPYSTVYGVELANGRLGVSVTTGTPV
jgi:CheY-specific phosphatase CheX